MINKQGYSKILNLRGKYEYSNLAITVYLKYSQHTTEKNIVRKVPLLNMFLLIHRCSCCCFTVPVVAFLGLRISIGCEDNE